MSNSEKMSRVIVVGAGIGGLTLALALARQGFQVRIFEQADVLKEVGAGLQLSPNAVKVLRTLALEDLLKPFVFQPENASIRHFQSGRYYLHYGLGDHATQRYGAPYWHVHRADLHGVLVQACYAAGVEIELGHKVLGYRSDKTKATVLLENKTEYCDLVVGADGIHSKIRELMLGIQAPIFTGQVAWRGVVRADNVKNVTIKPDATVWVGPNKHMVSYYLRGGDYINFVAVEECAEWSHESWRQEGNVQDLQAKFAGWHPEVSDLLGACEETFMWALNGRPTLPQWTDQRVVLLGDACHPMLPFMAQGAAMAIEDAYVLSQLLGKNDYEVAFAQYEAIRKPRATKVQKMSRENAGLYHMHGGVFGLAKLEALGVMSKVADGLIQRKLDSVYGYDVTSLPI